MKNLLYIICILLPSFCYPQSDGLSSLEHLLIASKKSYEGDLFDFKSSRELIVNLKFRDYNEGWDRVVQNDLVNKVIHTSQKENFVIARFTFDELSLLKHDILNFDIRHKFPLTESYLPDYDPGINNITLAKSIFPDFFEFMSSIGLKENNPKNDDIDLLEKIRSSEFSSDLNDQHATDMATLIVGEGNSFYTSKGLADNSLLVTSSFLNLMPDDISFFQDEHILVQNHSYGLEVEDYYGIEAEAYDRQVFENPEIIHVFSSGNFGQENALFSPYAEIEGVANLTGTFKQSKNVLTIGAIDSSFTRLPISSIGPAYDGRIKPEFVAYGYGGTSEAAAIGSGMVAVLQAWLQNQGLTSRFDVVKSLLILGAQDLGNPGPDFEYGYGNLDLYQSLKLAQESAFFISTIEDPLFGEFEYEVKDNIDQLKIVISWVDPSAVLDNTKALSVDLDLVTLGPNGEQYLPFVLESNVDPEILNKEAKKGVDTLNNSELIIIDQPSPGKYKILVKGDNSKVNWSVIINGSIPELQITNPIDLSYADNDKSVQLRWQTGTDMEVDIAYYINDELVESFKNRKGNRMVLPKVTTTSNVKVVISNGALSDSVSFSQGPVPKLDLTWDCGDALLLEALNGEDSSNYLFYDFEVNQWSNAQISELGKYYLIDNIDKSKYNAVQLATDFNLPSPLSPAVFIDNLSGNCFYEEIVIEGVEDKVNAFISFSVLFDIQEVVLEKYLDGKFRGIDSTSIIRNEISFLDSDLIIGDNTYRFKMITSTGKTYYSNEQRYRYIPEGEFLIFPTVGFPGDGITIEKNNDSTYNFRLYDSSGRLLSDYIFDRNIGYIATYDYAPGIYFFQIVEGKFLIKSGKVVIIN